MCRAIKDHRHQLLLDVEEGYQLDREFELSLQRERDRQLNLEIGIICQLARDRQLEDSREYRNLHGKYIQRRDYERDARRDAEIRNGHRAGTWEQSDTLHQSSRRHRQDTRAYPTNDTFATSNAHSNSSAIDGGRGHTDHLPHANAQHGIDHNTGNEDSGGVDDISNTLQRVHIVNATCTPSTQDSSQTANSNESNEAINSISGNNDTDTEGVTHSFTGVGSKRGLPIRPSPQAIPSGFHPGRITIGRSWIPQARPGEQYDAAGTGSAGRRSRRGLDMMSRIARERHNESREDI